MGSRRFVTFDYMNKFKCIGPECEDSCCNGWRVSLYQEDYERIRDYFEENDRSEKFFSAVELVPPENRFPGNYASLDFQEKSSCPLCEQGWCSLQRDKGEAMLPRVCATFPRNFYKFADQTEVHGLMPCPEVVRLCLLNPTPPVQEAMNPEGLPPHFEDLDCTGSDIEPYKRALPLVVDFSSRILNNARYGISEKLYLIFYFYRRISSFCFLDAEKDPTPRLENLIKRLDSDVALDRIMKEYKGMDSWPPQLLELLLGILAMRLKNKQSPRFRDLCTSVLDSFGEFGHRIVTHEALNSEQRAAVWRLFLERRALTQTRFGERIKCYVTNFCTVHLLQDLYMGGPSPLVSACKLAFSLAMIRFLFVGHPKVGQRLASDLPLQEDEPLLDEAIVHVVQTYMKYLGSDVAFTNQILEAMEKTRLNTQNHLAAFLMV